MNPNSTYVYSYETDFLEPTGYALNSSEVFSVTFKSTNETVVTFVHNSTIPSELRDSLDDEEQISFDEWIQTGTEEVPAEINSDKGPFLGAIWDFQSFNPATLLANDLTIAIVAIPVGSTIGFSNALVMDSSDPATWTETTVNGQRVGTINVRGYSEGESMSSQYTFTVQTEFEASYDSNFGVLMHASMHSESTYTPIGGTHENTTYGYMDRQLTLLSGELGEYIDPSESDDDSPWYELDFFAPPCIIIAIFAAFRKTQARNRNVHR